MMKKSISDRVWGGNVNIELLYGDGDGDGDEIDMPLPIALPGKRQHEVEVEVLGVTIISQKQNYTAKH